MLSAPLYPSTLTPPTGIHRPEFDLGTELRPIKFPCQNGRGNSWTLLPENQLEPARQANKSLDRSSESTNHTKQQNGLMSPEVRMSQDLRGLT